jgi:chromosome segregation ATPase
MLNWETVIVACIAGMGPALIGLLPLYWKMREEYRKSAEEIRQKSQADKLAEKKLQMDISEAARKASEELILQLTERVDALERNRDELEAKLDIERTKRREAERKLAEAEIHIARLQSKVERLEKKDTGELAK